MQAVRRNIIDILKETGSATVAELAVRLEMAQVSVRHHLDILVGEDLVDLSGVRRRNGAGRPSQVYTLTPEAFKLFPQRNDVLVASMLADMKANMSHAEVRGMLQRLAERTAREAPAGAQDGKIEVRLEQVTEFLTSKGYNARWEACGDHYEVHACNCPYNGVADHHPELCGMDQAMMHHLVPEAIRLQTRVLDGTAHCTYRINLLPAVSEGE